MKSTVILLTLLALMVAGAGCYTLNAVGTPADYTLSLSNHPSGSVTNHFSTTIKVHHFIYGLATLSDPDVAKEISDEVKAANGTNAINVKMRYEATFLDGLINVITAGIYNPFTLVIEGDVLK
jgi:hypothetical protein